VCDVFYDTLLEMKRNNQPRTDIYAPLILAAKHYWNTGNSVAVSGTPQNPEINT